MRASKHTFRFQAPRFPASMVGDSAGIGNISWSGHDANVRRIPLLERRVDLSTAFARAWRRPRAAANIVKQ